MWSNFNQNSFELHLNHRNVYSLFVNKNDIHKLSLCSVSQTNDNFSYPRMPLKKTNKQKHYMMTSHRMKTVQIQTICLLERGLICSGSSDYSEIT